MPKRDSLGAFMLLIALRFLRLKLKSFKLSGGGKIWPQMRLTSLRNYSLTPIASARFNCSNRMHDVTTIFSSSSSSSKTHIPPSGLNPG